MHTIKNFHANHSKLNDTAANAQIIGEMILYAIPIVASRLRRGRVVPRSVLGMTNSTLYACRGVFPNSMRLMKCSTRGRSCIGKPRQFCDGLEDAGQNKGTRTYLEERSASCGESVGNHVSDEECGCAG